jgi:hypothetical protein
MVGFEFAPVREYRPYGAYAFVRQCHRGDIRMPALEQIGQPSLGVVGLVLCRQDGRARPMDEQRAQVRIAAFTHPEQRWLAAAGAVARNQLQSGGDLPAVVKAVRIRDRCAQSARSQRAYRCDCRASGSRTTVVASPPTAQD